ncbi:hypothetical protein [Chitinimonas koreensis]|uniref:hypothetical protein n=1 Tax=Chitinimonas koreensis TaxID=356302 RepID=UPI0016548049|nr:hypothetical protein [Chitinimonas koreensis]QNM97704.1 hypothetical protein H9L41_05250 [Chitinimonas koreensis]
MPCSPAELQRKCDSLLATWQAYRAAPGFEQFVEFAVTLSSFAEFLHAKGLSGLHLIARDLEQQALGCSATSTPTRSPRRPSTTSAPASTAWPPGSATTSTPAAGRSKTAASATSTPRPPTCRRAGASGSSASSSSPGAS